MTSNPSGNLSPRPDDVSGNNANLEETSGFDSAPKESETGSPSSSTRIPERASAQRNKPRTVSGYRLAELLGQGGMGRVFRAEDSTGRSVALKLLSPDLARSEEALARFKQEGLIASQINHPHCVFVHRVDEDSGTPFIAMELMSGKTLKDLVQQRGPLPYEEAVRLILQCIDGLVEAHALGMIHRDIKPANCYLDEDGNVKIGDFGLARSLVSDSELTQTGAFLGTPLFASPEQLLGQVIDVRSDIYSLSATLYYLLAGKAPFESPHAAQVIAKIVSSDPPSFQSVGVDVPASMERIVMKGLARDLSKRYESFAQMREDLQATVAPKPVPASLVRRSLAWIADYFLVTSIVAILLFSISSANELSRQPFWAKAIGSFVIFLYYFISESLFSTSIGKAAMRILVVDSKTGNRITLRSAFVRTLSFIFATGILLLVVHLLFPNLNPVYESVLGFLFLFINPGLLYSTWNVTNKRQLLHDWASGTECRTSFGSRSTSPSVLILPSWKLPILPREHEPNAIPNALGRFTIDGEIQTTPNADGIRWLVGKDPQLDRVVWIACVADKSIEYEQQIRQQPKSKRLRFVEEGVEPRYRWFAYVAPDGVPLNECISGAVHFPWPITRSLLGTLLGEVNQETLENNSPDPLELGSEALNQAWNASRLWVDQAGRLSMVDFEPMTREPSHSKAEVNWASFVSQLAILGLPPRHRLRRRIHASHTKTAILDAENLPPLRSYKLLESIASRRFAPTPLQLKDALEKVDHGHHRVTNGVRFLTSAVSLGLMSPLIFIGLTMLAVPSIITFMDQWRDVCYLKSLQAFVQEPDRFQSAWNVAPDGAQALWTSDEKQSEVSDAFERESKRLSDAYYRLGTFERFIVSSTTQGGGSPLNPPLIGPLPEVSEGTESADASAIETTKSKVVAGPVTIINYEFGNELVTEKTMKSIVGSMDNVETSRTEDDKFPDLAFLLSALLFFVVWTTATFGGLTQYFTGICFVRRDGCRLGVIRSAWRAMVVYVPVLGLGLLLVYFNDQGLEGLWIATQLKRGLLLLPLVYLATTIPFWQRTPLDLLSGTAAIPR